MNQEEIANASTGVTGPPLSKEKLEALKRHNVEVARKKIKEELKSELKGISLTIIGTIIWAYGAYVPILFEITKT